MPKYYQTDTNTWSKRPLNDTDPVIEAEIDVDDLKWLDGDLFDVKIVGKLLLDAHVNPQDVLAAVSRVVNGSQQVPIPWEEETDAEFHDDQDIFDALTYKFVKKDRFIKALIADGYVGFRDDDEYQFFNQMLPGYPTHAQSEGTFTAWRRGQMTKREAVDLKRQGDDTPALYKCDDDLVVISDMPLYMQSHAPINIISYSTDQIKDLLEY